jgi:glycosyltransferase involved in cell wall biosynthesis
LGELFSVIVTTYNREDALDAVLRSLARQSEQDFEVVVAEQIGRRLDRVWHEDRGFRAAEIRNRTILASRGVYCIFLDGDCIVRPDFVATHRRLAEPGCFVTGNRILLSRELTAKVLREKLMPETWTMGYWLAERRHGGVNRLSALLRLPLGPLRRLRQREWRGARSCNLAIWRADLERVDGFDADYSGWGKEDSDIIVRLLHAGVRRKDGAFATGVLHLWHAEAERGRLAENERRLSDSLAGDRIRARRGLSAIQTAPAAVAVG